VPTFLPPRRGISQSQAYAEASSYATAGDPVLLTLALYHPDFRDEAGDVVAVYVVNDYRNLTATIEADADVDAGEQVEFIACAFRAVLPEESATNRLPEVTLEVDNVTRELTPYLRLAAASMTPVTAIFRTYLPSDTSEPHESPPLQVTLRGASVNGTTAQVRAGYGDLVNVPFPRVTYTREEFPGLQAA
jgi:hypothetical protein